MSTPERLPLAEREQLLGELLRRYPAASFAALRPDGVPTSLPSQMPLGSETPTNDRAAFFELIVPDDIWPAMAAWDRARSVGTGWAPLRLATNPDRHVEVHVIDMTDKYGVFIEITAAEDGTSPWPDRASAPNARPRVGVMHKDSQSVVLAIDQATTQLLGWAPEQMIGRRTIEFTDPDHAAIAVTTYIDMLRQPGSSRRTRVRFRRSDETWLWVEVTNHNLLHDPEHGYVLSEIVDVSEEMAYQEALRDREELLRRLTDALPVGVLHIDLTGRLLYKNGQLDVIVGGHPDATTIEQQFSLLRDADVASLAAALDDMRNEARDTDLDLVIERPDGARNCTLSLRVLRGKARAPVGAVLCITDVTESIRMRNELERRATTDSLTGCRTRASVLGLLEEFLRRGSAERRGTGVIFIDLDHFKDVNDRHGHATGDEFLAEVARRLLGAVRHGDAVGRLGGDEFLVLCDGINSAPQLSDVADRLSAALGDQVCIDEQVVAVSASFGIAWSQESVSPAEQLVAVADDAMYAVKRERRAGVTSIGGRNVVQVS